MLNKLKNLYLEGKVQVRYTENFIHKSKLPEYRTYLCALLFPENEGIISINEKNLSIDDKDLLLVSPANTIGFDLKDKPFKHINLYFSCPELQGYSFINADMDKLSMLKNNLYDLLDEHKKTHANSYRLDFLYSQFFKTLFNIPFESKKEYKLVLEIIDFLENNVDKSLNLDDISNEFDIETNRLSYLFNKYTGKGPIDYFIDYKMDRASVLLMDNTLRIKDISNMLGYNDPYYFSRIFKKKKGLSPNNYRKKLLNIQ